MDTINEENAKGEYIINLLSLKRKRENHRIDTMWGDKTPIGLYNTLKRIIETPFDKLPR